MADQPTKLIGMDRWIEAMETLRKIPAQINTASLHPIERADGRVGFDNADIMESLRKAKRNFVEPDDAGAEDIAEVFATEVERRLQRIMSKPSKTTDPKELAKLIGGMRGMSAREATSIAAGALTKAMRKYMKMVTEAMNNNHGLDGSNLEKVGVEYAGERAAKYDMPDDRYLVGRASGDLLDNVAHGTSAIRLTKE